MKSGDFDNLALEESADEHFGYKCEVAKIIVQEIDVAREVKASVFLTKKKQLLCLIHGRSKLNLGDVRKIVLRMGLVAELFMPPKGNPTYFDDVALKHFQSIFPGRKPQSDEDLSYYKTLASYNPALAIVREVKDGHIYQFDPDSRTGWRPSIKFTYRRIKTS